MAIIIACLATTTAFLSCGKESSDKQITAFSFTTPPAVGVINEEDKTIVVELPFGIDLTTLVPTITVSNGAMVSPTSGTPQNFTNPVIYTVTAEDGSTAEYIVTIEQSGYGYNGNSFKIAWAGYYYSSGGSGSYCLGISPTVPAGRLFNEPNFFEVEYPASKLGQKCDLSQNNYDGSWYLFGYLYSNGNKYFFEDNNSASDDVTGSNNWVKVTKNSADDNFTIEFSMIIGGKLLEGKYSGLFQRKNNHNDIGN